jgi:hypothetical protein
MSTPHRLPPESRLHLGCHLSNGVGVSSIELSTNGTILFQYHSPDGKMSYMPLWDVKILWGDYIPELIHRIKAIRNAWFARGEDRQAILGACLAEFNAE